MKPVLTLVKRQISLEMSDFNVSPRKMCPPMLAFPLKLEKIETLMLSAVLNPESRA